MRTILAVCVLILANLAAPVEAAQPDRPSVVAHRGLLRHAPENTLANFRACIELRMGFEFDVARTKDGHLVCIHDDTVDRTTNGHGQVAEMTLAQLRELDAGSWFDARFEGEKIPTIDEILKLIASDSGRTLLFAADLKSTDVEQEVAAKADRLGILDRLIFIGRTITEQPVRERILKTAPKARTAIVAHDAEEMKKALTEPGNAWVYFRYLPTSEQIQAVHLSGRQSFIAGATVAGHLPENWKRARAAGIDAILTDYPFELSEALRGKSSK